MTVEFFLPSEMLRMKELAPQTNDVLLRSLNNMWLLLERKKRLKNNQTLVVNIKLLRESFFFVDRKNILCCGSY